MTSRIQRCKDSVFERLARGDPTAVQEICVRYGERVTKIARRRLGAALRARLETADISQDAMVEILRVASHARFRSEEDFLGWINVIVERRVLHAAAYWRAAKRKGESPLPVTRAHQADRNAELPSQIVLRREEVDRLSVALAELPGPDRQIIIARALLELSWDDVAVSLKMRKTAAQMRFTRARRRLAKLLR